MSEASQVIDETLALNEADIFKAEVRTSQTLELEKDWFGMKVIPTSLIAQNDLKPGDKVEVEISGGRKRPIVQKIRKV